MSVDRATVAIGEPFHLSIATHVDEPVTQLDNLTLPDLSGFDSLGDERRCVATAAGSDCIETVSLAATVSGVRTIPGATLDAVDARNGKPSRFTSDSVTITVTGAPFVDPLHDMVSGFVFGALRAFLIFLFVAVAVFALIWGFVTRRRKNPVAPAAPAYVAPAPYASPPDPAARLRALADELAREPTRANALRLRQALRDRLNARDEETYADLLARRAGEPRDLAALGAVERPAFCEDERVADAVREALPSLTF